MGGGCGTDRLAGWGAVSVDWDDLGWGVIMIAKSGVATVWRGSGSGWHWCGAMVTIGSESGQRKYRLQRDSDVRFLLFGQTVVPEVYVDLVEKVARDVRDQPAVPPRRSPIPIRVPVAPSPPPFATELVPTTQQFRLRPEVPIWDGDNGIWDGDNGIQDTFIADEQERVDANDSYSSDGDEIHESREVFTSHEDDVDTNTQGQNTGQNQGQNQWQCGAYRQTCDAIPSHWVVPFTKTNFNSLCHEYYRTSWMQTAYAPSINPVPHPTFWEVPDEVASMIVLPPDSKRQAGRLKEIRTPFA
ncbi:hypothetical protein LWI29_010707 [Acer saccharum]|uniref:Uncharacterized protein n=1 Tax=Acer saccharum TaxID=4024 RepID=A0AA39VFR3_ACESA|nr:hypothetical protein LWI29_010707 [Acer saccharum]